MIQEFPESVVIRHSIQKHNLKAIVKELAIEAGFAPGRMRMRYDSQKKAYIVEQDDVSAGLPR